MNREFCSIYQDALAKAFIVLTPQGKRLAVFPYGVGADDVPEKQARKHAWRFMNGLNGQPDIERREEDQPATEEEIQAALEEMKRGL